MDKRSEEWIDPNVYRKARRPKQYKRKFKNPRLPPKVEPDKPKRHPSPATIKKATISLRTAWNWARRQLGLTEEFPGGKLDYAKIEEGLPFMTWDEAERRIAAGDDPEKVWDCLYLRPAEITELLEYVKTRPVSPWVLPMFVFAAYTGARRSEIVRALPSDIDLPNGFITLRERKRDKTKTTTRRVPISPVLRESLVQWMKDRTNGKTLFCKGDGKAIAPREAHNYFQRALRTSRWSVIRGWHALRHSFVSTRLPWRRSENAPGVVRSHVARNVASLCSSLAFLPAGSDQERVWLSIYDMLPHFHWKENAIIIGWEPAQAVHQGRPYYRTRNRCIFTPEKPRITITVPTNKIML